MLDRTLVYLSKHLEQITPLLFTQQFVDLLQDTALPGD
jgi:hypothetical protein